jgi:hypothetical protein
MAPEVLALESSVFALAGTISLLGSSEWSRDARQQWSRFASRRSRPHRVASRLRPPPGRREIAAILLALIPFATGAVPDGLDLGTMRFNPAAVVAALEDGSDDHGYEVAPMVAAIA